MSEKKNPQLERRIVRPSDLRAAAPADDGKTVALNGHAAVFNLLSEDLGGFRERIIPGFFANALENDPDTKFLVNHRDLPLAATRSEDLVLEEDEMGLYFEATLDAEDPDVDRVVRKVKPGKLDKMSFAFTVLEDRLLTVKGEIIRELVKIGELFDVSIVTYPAYPDTSVALRSIERAGLLHPDVAGTEVRRRELELATSAARARGLVG